MGWRAPATRIKILALVHQCLRIVEDSEPKPPAQAGRGDHRTIGVYRDYRFIAREVRGLIRPDRVAVARHHWPCALMAKEPLRV